MTTTEMNNIIKAGKDLEGFAAIAGMTENSSNNLLKTLSVLWLYQGLGNKRPPSSV